MSSHIKGPDEPHGSRITRRQTSSIHRPASIPDLHSLVSMAPLLEDIADRMGLGFSISDDEEHPVYSSRSYDRLIERHKELLEDVIMFDFDDTKVLLKLLSPYDQDKTIARLAQMAIVGEISVGLAHDFRNVLAVIASNLDCLRSELHSVLSPTQESPALDIIQDMEQAINLATELCKRTERLGSQKSEKGVQPEDVRALLAAAVKMTQLQQLNARDEGKVVTIENRVTEPLWASMAFSEVQMAVLNILFNAIRYSGGKGKEGKIVINAYSSESRVHILIENNGPPIPEDVRENLLKKPLTAACVHGYGLYTAVRSLSGFGGEMSFTSGPEETIFMISLPLAQPSRN